MDKQIPESDAPHLVILIHGIRTHANHFSEIKKLLKSHGFEVEFTNYGRFDLLRFLLPFDYFRERSAQKVWGQIEDAIDSHNGPEKISYIAHSFGTYILGKILRTKPRFKAHKIILCGSVLPYDFDLSNFSSKFEGSVLNEVGTKDFWPAIAQSVTTGYGSAGTYGFKKPYVEDRWHNDMKHSDFNTSEFCGKYWVPLLRDGSVVEGSVPHKKTPWYIDFLGVFQLKWVVAGLFVASTAWGISLVEQNSEDPDKHISTSVYDAPHKVVPAQLETSCTKSSDSGCTGRKTEVFTFFPGYLILKSSTRVTAQSGVGINPVCELKFRKPHLVDFEHVDEMYEGVELTAHIESGSGFSNMGKMYAKKCEIDIYLVEYQRTGGA